MPTLKRCPMCNGGPAMIERERDGIVVVSAKCSWCGDYVTVRAPKEKTKEAERRLMKVWNTHAWELDGRKIVIQ